MELSSDRPQCAQRALSYLWNYPSACSVWCPILPLEPLDPCKMTAPPPFHSYEPANLFSQNLCAWVPVRLWGPWRAMSGSWACVSSSTVLSVTSSVSLFRRHQDPYFTCDVWIQMPTRQTTLPTPDCSMAVRLDEED